MAIPATGLVRECLDPREHEYNYVVGDILGKERGV